MSSAEINALITLLEDPDEGIFEQIKKALIQKGDPIVPHLEHYWKYNNYGPLFQDRIEHLLKSIKYQSTMDRLYDWKANEKNDLLEGALLINGYQYPEFDAEEIRGTISKIRQDIWLELNDQLTAMEIVNVFNHILYTVYGFEGNKKDFTSPQNSFIADVLSSGKGNPLSLSILYQVLASQLDVPIYGVNLPNHFILAYLDENHVGMDAGDVEDNGALFYINPFSGGTIIHKNEIDDFLFHLNLPKKVKYYRPCANNDIIKRMLTNLIFSYTQQKKDQKVEELKALHAIFCEPVSEES
ncbi:MAG: hypothetical protein HRT74_05230 [Flavobacteriales bacterium]|nr:hypothetical protein [Flavobacteriales bacterium]